jgi:hypothetical protein
MENDRPSREFVDRTVDLLFQQALAHMAEVLVLVCTMELETDTLTF